MKIGLTPSYFLHNLFWAHRDYIIVNTAAAAKSLQSCPTLCDPIDGSPPGSPVPGILQARTLEWVAISFSSSWKGKVKVKSLSHVRLLVTPWTATYQAPLSMGFSREEYWSGVPLPSPLLTLIKWIPNSWQVWGQVWEIKYSHALNIVIIWKDPQFSKNSEIK